MANGALEKLHSLPCITCQDGACFGQVLISAEN